MPHPHIFFVCFISFLSLVYSGLFWFYRSSFIFTTHHNWRFKTD